MNLELTRRWDHKLVVKSASISNPCDINFYCHSCLWAPREYFLIGTSWLSASAVWFYGSILVFLLGVRRTYFHQGPGVWQLTLGCQSRLSQEHDRPLSCLFDFTPLTGTDWQALEFFGRRWEEKVRSGEVSWESVYIHIFPHSYRAVYISSVKAFVEYRNYRGKHLHVDLTDRNLFMSIFKKGGGYQ